MQCGHEYTEVLGQEPQEGNLCPCGRVEYHRTKVADTPYEPCLACGVEPDDHNGFASVNCGVCGFRAFLMDDGKWAIGQVTTK